MIFFHASIFKTHSIPSDQSVARAYLIYFWAEPGYTLDRLPVHRRNYLIFLVILKRISKFSFSFKHCFLEYYYFVLQPQSQTNSIKMSIINSIGSVDDVCDQQVHSKINMEESLLVLVLPPSLIMFQHLLLVLTQEQTGSRLLFFYCLLSWTCV